MRLTLLGNMRVNLLSQRSLSKIGFILVFLCLSHTCCDAQGRNVAVPEYKFEDRLFKNHILSRMRDESMNICFISVQEHPGSNSIIYVNYVDSYDLHECEIDKIYGVVRAKSCLIFLDGASNEKVFRETRQKKRLVIQCTQTYPENVDDGIQESFVVKDTGIMRINWEVNRLEPIAPKQKELTYLYLDM